MCAYACAIAAISFSVVVVILESVMSSCNFSAHVVAMIGVVFVVFVGVLFANCMRIGIWSELPARTTDIPVILSCAVGSNIVRGACRASSRKPMFRSRDKRVQPGNQVLCCVLSLFNVVHVSILFPTLSNLACDSRSSLLMAGNHVFCRVMCASYPINACKSASVSLGQTLKSPIVKTGL